MPQIRDLLAWMDRFAPLATAESWDNVGLLLGDPSAAVERVMTCLTVTPKVAEEAVRERVDAVVSHHPILFRGAKSIVAGDRETGVVWTLAKAGVAVLSPHTAFDNAREGINQLIADALSLSNVEALRPAAFEGPARQFKVVVFTPESDRAAVLEAAFAAGAGRIGAYEQCSFATAGQGTYFGLEGSNPTVGEPGRREHASELRLEFVAPSARLAAILAAVRSAHSYEEPAIDVFPTAATTKGHAGSGRVGELPDSVALGRLAERAATAVGATAVQWVGDPDRPTRRVAICCGAGDDFLPDARKAKADVLVTGEARFHRALEAEATGIGLILVGHHPGERFGVEALALRIREAFPGATVWASRDESDPIRTMPV